MDGTTNNSNVYIGNRYVPIFDGEWDSTKKYEPLVIVTYQGNSYTSRTFVAEGIPVTNETYWALTGNYNAQIEAYRKEVADLKEIVDNLTPQSQGRNIIVIMDDNGNTSNCKELIEHYKYCDSIRVYAFNGAGIIAGENGNNFSQCVLQVAAQISEKEKITDVIICGGLNDSSVDLSNIQSAFNALLTNIQISFSKAIPQIIFSGVGYDSKKVFKAWKTAAKNLILKFSDLPAITMRNPHFIDSDGKFLSEYIFLYAQSILNAILDNSQLGNLNFNFSINSNADGVVQGNGHVCEIYTPEYNREVSILTSDTTFIECGVLDGNIGFFTDDGYNIESQIVITIRTSENILHTFTCYSYFDNAGIMVKFDKAESNLPNNTEINFIWVFPAVYSCDTIAV